MIKILYAANNSLNSQIQLSRFIAAMEGLPYIIKVAAYKKSSPKINIDWTLDCLLNVFKPDHISLENENFHIYYEQIKNYKPDLIISDLEYFTSYIADILSIPIWQCSSRLINLSLDKKTKYNIGLFKKYYHLLHNNPLYNQRITNIVNNATCNLVYSHFGDLENTHSLKEGFEWIRPYFEIGKDYVTCQHTISGVILQNNKQLLSIIKNYEDSVIFSYSHNEKYDNPILKDINNLEEYFCNLKNSYLFICEGYTNFLADAYYNNKYSLIYTDYKNIECVINSVFSDHFGIGSIIYSDSKNLLEYNDRKINLFYNEKIKFLHEKILEEL